MSKSKYKSGEITAENIRSCSLLWVNSFLQRAGRNFSTSFCSCKLQEGISVYHFVPAKCRKEFQRIFLLLQVAGRNFSVSFCSCKVQEGISTHLFAPATCRKELSPDVLLLQLAGRNFSLSFCCSELEEGISVYHFVAPSWRKELPYNKFSTERRFLIFMFRVNVIL